MQQGDISPVVYKRQVLFFVSLNVLNQSSEYLRLKGFTEEPTPMQGEEDASGEKNL